jgi:hypothetical protein|tara:strand:+ start:471 stop:710 length:240 start_codon:yes stop_codon:yes gene_type:complete
MGGAVARIVRPSRPTPAPTPAPIAVAPTAPEVSQATATSMDGYDSRKTKAKGRSATIMTSSKGVEDETLTLGRRSLLGQ